MRLNLGRSLLSSTAAGLVLAALVAPADDGAELLRAGPMVGYSEPREVLLWAQTAGPARVKFAYWDEAAPEIRYETEEKATLRSEAFIARLVADRLRPGRRYAYELQLNGRPVPRPYPLRFQARMPRGAYGGGPTGLTDLKVALGSCYWAPDPAAGPEGRRGQEYPVFAAIAAWQPDLMLWLGDNVYMQDIDWSSRSGLFARYGHNRALPELQPLLGSVHHYATWDDHDYGPNDSDRSYRDKNAAREAFVQYWGNPSAGVEGSPGVTTRFEWADVDFFLLDNRWNRSPNMRSTGRRQVFGEAQIEWLLDALASSRATFKVIVSGGQILNPVRTGETYANYPDEREDLLKRILAERVNGVLFLTGDRHFSELAKLDRPGAYPLYELTASPLATWVVRNADREPNPLRVPGTLVAEENFGTLEVTGPRNERRLALSIFDARGGLKWTRTLAAAELRPAD